MTEKWKKIKGFSDYKVSDFGRVKSFKHKKVIMLKPGLRGPKLKPYYYVNLRKDGKTHPYDIHRLVLETFVGPCPEGHEGRHLDGNYNRNFLINLKWGTKKENAQDKFKHGTDTSGGNNGHSKFTNDQAKVIREKALIKGITVSSCRELAKGYSVCYQTIHNILCNVTYKNIS